MAIREKTPELFDSAETVGFLAEEDRTDRRVLWRLGAWAIGAVGAVTLAVFVSQSAIEQRRVTFAESSNATRQAQQLQSLIGENKSEANRLALAVETLNNDRDRLYARVSTLEQGLDSVTGTVNRRAAAAVAPPADRPVPSPVQSRPPLAAVVETPSPLMPAKSLMSPPDPAATTLSEPSPPSEPSRADSKIEPKQDLKSDVVAAVPDAPASEPSLPANLGADLGTAPSMDGLRLLWRRVAKAYPEAIGLQPIVAIRERPGPAGVQLRLIAGPLNEAAAAQLCTSLRSAGTACEPTSFDGQKLTLANSTTVPAAPKLPRRKTIPKPVQQPSAPTAPPVAAR